MTQTKVHHAHPACSDTRWGIISQSGLSIPMCFIRRWLGPCTCCWTKSPRARHREPPPLWQPPLFLKQRHKGRNDRDRKEPPLAMLKQTHLEQGLDYCTRQGFFFFPLLPLLIVLANSWWPQAWRPPGRGPAETRGKRTEGSLCKGEHLEGTSSGCFCLRAMLD